MKLGNLFGKATRENDAGTKVLVLSLHPRFSELRSGDAEAYSKFYPGTTIADGTVQGLSARTKGYDIVHLFGDVSVDGFIRDVAGETIIGTELIRRCCDNDVKLLWVASDNRPEGYIAGFKAGKNRLNLVMTLDRKGPKFPAFLQNLLARMSTGETMPAAWAALAPQHRTDPVHHALPECIFSAGRGEVKLKP